MKIAIGAGGSGSDGENWEALVDFVIEAEKLGVDTVWTAEAGGIADFGDNLEQLIDKRRERIAFRLGAMGSKDHNFFNDAFSKAGYKDACREVQSLWLQGKRDAAVLAVPDDLVIRSNLLGTTEMVKERVRVYRDAGITTLRVDPDGSTLQQRLDNLGQIVEIVREVTGEDS